MTKKYTRKEVLAIREAIDLLDIRILQAVRLGEMSYAAKLYKDKQLLSKVVARYKDVRFEIRDKPSEEFEALTFRFGAR